MCSLQLRMSDVLWPHFLERPRIENSQEFVLTVREKQKSFQNFFLHLDEDPSASEALSFPYPVIIVIIFVYSVSRNCTIAAIIILVVFFQQFEFTAFSFFVFCLLQKETFVNWISLPANSVKALNPPIGQSYPLALSFLHLPPQPCF